MTSPATPRRPRREFPLWLLVLVLGGVIVLWLIAENADYAEIGLVLSRGIVTTIWVTKSLVACGSIVSSGAEAV